jgi:pilus assembly protein CpaF
MITDIFNRRGGGALRPTGYLPTFIDSLVGQQLLDVDFFYDTEGQRA